MLDFTIGLTEGVAWPWPIAVYLFLAGISGGAVAVAICVNLFKMCIRDRCAPDQGGKRTR